MIGNWPFGTRKAFRNDKTSIYDILDTIWRNRKKLSFLIKISTSKIFKVDFCWPIISGQYCDMGDRYIPSGPPRPHNMEVIPLPLLSYIWCWNSGLRLEKPTFFGFCCFCCFCCFSGYHDVAFRKVWIFSFLWNKKSLKYL